MTGTNSLGLQGLGVKGTVRHWGGRFVGWIFEAAGTPPPGIPTGGVGGPDADDRPVVVAVLLGADEATVAGTARALADVTRGGGPRAVLLLDGPYFAAARRAGVIADHVLSRTDWAARHDPARWDAYVESEILRLRRDVGADEVIRMPASGDESVRHTVLQAIVLPKNSSRLRRGWRSRMARLERRIDRGAD